MKKPHQFFQELGQRIAKYRKEQNLSQAKLGEMLGLKQQMVASYEAGIRRLPISLLYPLAESLNISVEELLGVPGYRLKPGPTPKLQKKIEQIKQLPKEKQKLILDLVDTVLQSEEKLTYFLNHSLNFKE